VLAKITDESKSVPQVCFRFGRPSPYEKAIDMKQVERARRQWEGTNLPLRRQRHRVTYIEAYGRVRNGPAGWGTHDRSLRIEFGTAQQKARSSPASMRRCRDGRGGRGREAVDLAGWEGQGCGC